MERSGKAPQAAAAALLEQARLAREAGRLEEAEQACRRAVQLDPDNAEARWKLGAVQRERGDPSAAEATLRGALAIAPDNLEGVQLGDTVYFHVTNIEQDWDILHGFAVLGAENSELILNPGETGILGVGRIVEKPAVYRGEITRRAMMTLSLTFDHRTVDGAPAAAFLPTVIEIFNYGER